ncbi:MAG: AMP-binding protein, partial [Sphingomonadaceae bacterium]|nr:AMP-binding protein [Sphingomonadaceae bacterium]
MELSAPMPATSERNEGVHSLPIDHVLLRGDPARAALDGRSGSYSFAELENTLGRLAGWLAGSGLEPGARVASWVAKGPVAA